jgi:hypothetical protein
MKLFILNSGRKELWDEVEALYYSKQTQDMMQILSQQISSFAFAQNIFLNVSCSPLACLGCVEVRGMKPSLFCQIAL